MFSVSGAVQGKPSEIAAALAVQIAAEKTRVPQASTALDGVAADVAAALTGVSDAYSLDGGKTTDTRVVDVTFNPTVHSPGIEG
jgi:hypothetical protein